MLMPQKLTLRAATTILLSGFYEPGATSKIVLCPSEVYVCG